MKHPMPMAHRNPWHPEYQSKGAPRTWERVSIDVSPSHHRCTSLEVNGSYCRFGLRVNNYFLKSSFDKFGETV